MPNYKKMYFKLFNSLTDAIEEFKKHNYGNAEEILRKAQRETEQDYIDDAEEDNYEEYKE